MYKYMKHSCEELRQILTKNFLEKYLIKNNFSYKEVGKIVGCSDDTVKRHAKKFGVESFEVREMKKYNQILTKEFLLQHAIDSPRGKVIPLTKIAKIVGCTGWTIKNKALKFDLLIANKKEINIEDKKKGINKYKGKPYDSKRINKKTGHVLIKIEGRGWIREHNYVMEQYLNRKLKPGEEVHHINENPSDNNLENLQLVTPSEHMKIHWNKKFTFFPIRNFIGQSEYYKNILKRDNYTCQKCGSKENLEVHHIKPLNIIFEEFLNQYPHLNPTKNKEEVLALIKTYKPFWDLNNGQTLCLKCHCLVEQQEYSRKE